MNLLSKIVLVIGIILLPFSYIRLVSNFSISDLFFLLSFIFGLAVQFKHKGLIREKINSNIFLVSITIYSFGFIISANSSFYPYDSIFSFFQVLFIFIIIYYSFSFQEISYSFIRNCLYLLALFSSIITFFMFLFYLTGVDYSSGFFFIKQGWGMNRFSYGTMEPNITARIMAQNIPIIIFFILNKPKWSFRLINIFILLLLLSIIILTASRSGLLIVIFGIFLYFVFYFRMNKNYNILKYFIFIFLIFFLVGTLFQMYPNFFESAFNRYSTIIDYNFSASSKQRLFVFDQSLDMINNSVLIGKGMGNSANFTGTAVHNPVIISWLENGFFGFIGFLSIYLILFYYVIINYRNKFFNDYMLMVLSLIAIMMIIGDMFMANSYKRSLWVPAIMFIIYSKQKLKIHFKNK